MSASYYLTTMVDNCIPRWQLGSCSVTRPFLSLQMVWLAKLHHSLPCMWTWMKLLHNLSESPKVTLISFLVLAMYASLSRYVAHFHIAPDGYQADAVRWTFIQDQNSLPRWNFYARVSSRAPFLYLKNKQPNLALLSGRLTSSSDLATSWLVLVALRYKGHPSVVTYL